MPDTSSATELVVRIMDEGLIGMSAAARLYGVYRSGKATSPATVLRHHVKGVPLPGGALLRLEAIRVGGKIMTSKQAVVRFIAAQNEPLTSDLQPVPLSPSSRSRAALAAGRELDSMGVY